MIWIFYSVLAIIGAYVFLISFMAVIALVIAWLSSR